MHPPSRAALIVLLVAACAIPLFAQVRRGVAASNSSSRSSGKSPAQIAEASLCKFHGHADGVLALAFSPDGRTLASGGADNAIILWNLADGSILKRLEGHSEGVDALDFSPDGTRLLSGGMEGGINLWNLATGRIEYRIAYDRPASFVSFLGNNHLFANGWGNTLFFVDAVTDHSMKARTDDTISSMLYTSDGFLITADQKANLIVWDPKTATRLHQFSRPLANRNDTHDTGPNWIMGMSALKNGNVLLCDMTGFWSWNRTTDNFHWIGKNLYNLRAAFDNDRFYCGGSDSSTLWFRDMNADGFSLLIGEPWHIHAIAASPKDDWLALGGGGAYESNRGWRTAGPTDIRLLKINDIAAAMAAQKERSAGTPDHSSITPADPQPLPWQKLK